MKKPKKRDTLNPSKPLEPIALLELANNDPCFGTYDSNDPICTKECGDCAMCIMVLAQKNRHTASKMKTKFKDSENTDMLGYLMENHIDSSLNRAAMGVMKEFYMGQAIDIATIRERISNRLLDEEAPIKIVKIGKRKFIKSK